MLLELLLETAMAIVALFIYFSISSGAPRWNRLGIFIALLLLAILTWGSTFLSTLPQVFRS
jgi:ABC-type polysaccharide/polyol phosphate export permease